MFGEYYKVSQDFIPEAEQEDNNVLALEKGDIVVDVEPVDDKWVIGRNMLSQESGKIMRRLLTEFNEAEPKQDDETKAANENSSKQTGMQVTVNPLSSTADRSKEKSDSVRYSQATPAPKFTNDEGYTSGTSCSNDSGERIVLTQTEPTVLEDKIVELPRRPPRNRPSATVKRTESFQDEDGYEIPILSQSKDYPLEEIQPKTTAQQQQLKFKFGRKFSDVEQETALIRSASTRSDRSRCVRHKPSVSSDNAFSEEARSVTASTRLKETASPDHVVFTKRHRTKILVSLAVSAVVSLACLLIWLVACGWPALMSVCLALLVFALLLFVPFTFLNGRVICVVLLTLPGVFAPRLKGLLLLVVCCLLIVGPVCHIAGNMAAAVNCSKSNESTDSNFTARAVKLFPHAVDHLNSNSSNATVKATNSRELYSYCTYSHGALREMCLVLGSRLDVRCAAPNTTLLGNGQCSNASAMCKTKRDISRQCERMVTQDAGVDPELDSGWGGDCLGSVLVQLLPLVVLVLLYEAYTYHRLYLTNKTVDNVYITRKLKVIDCERSKRGLTNTLFPLRKAEFRRYLLPSSMGYTHGEFRALVFWLVIWAAACLVSFAAMGLDAALYKALAHGAIHCRLRPPSSAVNTVVYAVLGLYFAVILFSCHVLRIRSRICAMFYTRREITRIMHLYYTILDERDHFWGVHRRKVQLLAEARRLSARHSLLLNIHGSLPSRLQRVWDRVTVQRCMVCRSLAFKRCFVCLDSDCCAVFCYECYIDAGGVCVACRPQVNSGSSTCCEYVETR